MARVTKRKGSYESAAYKKKKAARTSSYKSRTSYLSKYSRSANQLGMTKEHKMYDVQFNAAGLNVIGNVATVGVCLNTIAVGDDLTDRIGRRIALHSITLDGVLSSASVVAARIVIVYDKHPNSVMPTTGTLFQSTTSFSSMTNLNNQGRFIMLFDQEYKFDGTGGNTVNLVKMFKFLNGIPTNYSGTTGSIGSIDAGAVILFAFDSSGAVVTFEGYSRIKYSDN